MTNLSSIATDLQVINNLLVKYEKNKALVYEDALVLSTFYLHYKDTNAIIAMAEDELNTNAEHLLNAAKQLSEATASFSAIYNRHSDFFQSFNPKPICDAHLKPFEEQYEEAKDISTQLWKDYSSLSNRLDFMAYEDDDFKPTEAKCDNAKAAYDEAHAKTNFLFDSFDKERRKTASLYYFDMMFLEVLVTRIDSIAKGIIVDIDNLKAQGAL
ncbi:MAG: hypothetical protein EOM41_06340 [Bacilli bacterium]|jgi:DNA repair ATPase RecN|nr:hypothetical protein [Bacilli bacterium]